MSEFQVPTPCYLIDRSRLKENLTVLDEIRKRTGCKILFAQKAFSCYPFYSMMSRYLDGTSATGEYEAQLAHLYFHGENHVCGAVYRPEEMEKLLNSKSGLLGVSGVSSDCRDVMIAEGEGNKRSALAMEIL